ncbi:sugar phosphate isomerase/epimerase family protein [Oscillatoria sp. FACHB-1406]|uniref:sugar phosphate isomerase/epimerase family protein n=1 Tax=Oscillatoria sp. FACHB-1406 TaxID=2692846 RepID=UPI001682186F|nr:sugar phosphate isomerase/epimerase family protein [Oscillatoria sp. FACHB-1406]MBD2578383.1 sugar phosphate isomerase/epimerase [Oscillatoria sp. FACHB-1406]
MFTTNLKPHDSEARKVAIHHIKALKKFGYNGFEFPIAPGALEDAPQEIENYANLRREMDAAGLNEVRVATNVGATPQFDPSSSNPAQQQEALTYLKSRVDITVALGGEILMGPIVVPYGAYPVTASDSDTPLWSDKLQDELAIRYANAQPILNELGEYAEQKKVKLAIEPITHWETPGPNTLAQLIEFLKGVPSKQVGVVIDTAHEILDGAGPEIFQQQVNWLAEENRLHYVQVSPPDRGAVHTSWIPWQALLKPIVKVYDGPIAIEVFNAIPEFQPSLRLTRRKFWIPGEDAENQYPSAYDIARDAIAVTRQELNRLTPNHKTA